MTWVKASEIGEGQVTWGRTGKTWGGQGTLEVDR